MSDFAEVQCERCGVGPGESVAALEALRVSERRYRTAFDTSLDAIVITRMDDGMFVDVNRQFFSILGYTREELVGQSSEELCVWADGDGQTHHGSFLDVAGRSSRELHIWVDPDDRENLIARLRNASVCRDFEARLRSKDGTVIWGRISASVLELDDVQCGLFVIRDISAAKAAEEEIRNLSLYDGLTCLPNRRHLLERLGASRGDPAEQAKSALLSINLDHFRTVNDSFGAGTGDLLLQEGARRIAACVRDGDTVARSGGDEFLVILEHVSDRTEEAAAKAQSIAQRVLTALGQPYQLAGRECRITASIGITIFGGADPCAEEILQQSHIAVHHARQAGRNTTRFFAPALQTAINERVAMEADLRAAIERGELELYYQPQIDGRKLAGAEALVRWRHPRRGLLAPGEFIPLAEETGLILPLGNWVLEAACRQAAVWGRDPGRKKIRIAVNISARQFRQADFVEKVLEIVTRTRVDPRTIELELTESTLVDDLDQVVARMSELKAHGFWFSVDDFGIGYSSLSYLKRLPLDKLKIDISFVRDILVDPGSRAIAQAIISLARALDLSVIAEGVESEEQRDLLARLGCDAYQGFLCSQPLPFAELEAMTADAGAVRCDGTGGATDAAQGEPAVSSSLQFRRYGS